ncbi:MAG: heat-inducible transcriptional repressor HrcA, partial [Chloroflexota bacterium]
QEDLTRTANRVNADLGGRNLRGVRRKAGHPTGIEGQVVEQLIADMQALETPTGEQFFRDGLLNIMSQPEFERTETVRHFMAAFESGRLMEGVVGDALAHEGVHVIIGNENKSDEMRQCSIVLSRYGRDGEGAGVLGIVGPTRMPYSRVISTVRYTASILEELVHAVHGAGEGSPENETRRTRNVYR